MRADRLLSLVDLLRRHGRMSATELARRLEVTPRTVMRDIDSLSLLGVPVVAERGRHGGYELLPGYRPDAEDLTPDEVRALLVAGGPGVAESLGLGDAFARAVRRVASGLPDGHVQTLGHLTERVVIDPGGWGSRAARPPEALATLFDAVQRDRRLRVDYRALSSGQGGRRTLDPWGLVLAGSTWYLVAAHRGSPHTYRVSRFASVTTLPEAATRPPDLDLLATWQTLRSRWNQRPSTAIELLVAAQHLQLVVANLGLVAIGEVQRVPAEREGWVRVSTHVSSLRGTVAVVLGFGAWVEAVSPLELRELIREVARESLAVHEEAGRPQPRAT